MRLYPCAPDGCPAGRLVVECDGYVKPSVNSPGRRGIPKAESFTTEAKPAPDGALNLFLWFERAGLALDLPANLCAGSADVRRYHPVPANRVGTRVHYIWLVNAALNAETEHVLADAAAPIRLRRRAHGAHGDGMESLFSALYCLT